MTITKFEHACLVLDKDGKHLVIDPGMMTKLPATLNNVVGIFITHIHQDHLDKNNIQQLLTSNPDAQVIASPEVLHELTELTATKTEIKAGDKIEVSPFHLEVFGHDHAVIYAGKVPCINTGVMVDDTLYYPGDSFTLPNKPVEVLAVPTNAPWLKTAEAMDFIKAVKPRTAFPTHNGLLNETGQMLNHNLLEQASREAGSQFKVLKPGESL